MRFTGGDGYTGYEKLVHDIMMVNELNNGEGAYQLSDAKLGNSGYSFGGNQMDLLKNPHAKNILDDILKNNGLISFDEPLRKNLLETVTTPGMILSETNLTSINKALASDYGKVKINEAYREEISNKMEGVKVCISGSNDKIKTIIEGSDYLKAFLFDYSNQFGLKVDGKMSKFLKGKEVTLYDENFNKRSLTLSLENLNEGSLIDQLVSFVKSTKYYNKPDDPKKPGDTREKRRQNIQNRHAKLTKVVQGYTPISPKQPNINSVNLFLSQWNINIEQVNTQTKEKLAQILAHYEAQKEEIDRQNIKERTLQNFTAASQSFQAIELLGRTAGNEFLIKAGQVGMQVTNIALNVASLTGTLGLTAVTGFAALGPYAGIAIAGISLYNLIRTPRTVENSLIKSLLFIEDEIRQLEKVVTENFTLVNENLSKIYTLTYNGIQQILLSVNELKLSIFFNLNEIKQEVDRLQKLYYGSVHNLFLQPLEIDIARLDNDYLGADKDNLSEREIEEGMKILNNLESWVTHLAGNDLVNGKILWDDNIQPSHFRWHNRVLTEFNSNSITIIAYLVALLKSYEITLKDVNLDKLMNVDLWSFCITKYYLPLLNMLKDRAPRDFIEKKLKNIQTIIDITDSLKNLVIILRTDKTIHEKFLNLYLTALNDLEIFINKSFRELDRTLFGKSVVSILDIRSVLSEDKKIILDGHLTALSFYYNCVCLYANLGGLNEYVTKMVSMNKSVNEQLKQPVTLWKCIEVKIGADNEQINCSSSHYLLSTGTLVYITYAPRLKNAIIHLLDLNSGEQKLSVNIKSSPYGKILEQDDLLVVCDFYSPILVYNKRTLDLIKEIPHDDANDSVSSCVIFRNFLLTYIECRNRYGETTHKLKIYDINSGKVLKSTDTLIYNQVIKISDDESIFLSARNNYDCKFIINRFNPATLTVEQIKTIEIDTKGSYQIGGIHGKNIIFYGFEPNDSKNQSYSMVVYNIDKGEVTHRLPYNQYRDCRFVSVVDIHYVIFASGSITYKWNLDTNDVVKIYTMPKYPGDRDNFLTIGSVYTNQLSYNDNICGVIRSGRYYDYVYIDNISRFFILFNLDRPLNFGLDSESAQCSKILNQEVLDRSNQPLKDCLINNPKSLLELRVNHVRSLLELHLHLNANLQKSSLFMPFTGPEAISSRSFFSGPNFSQLKEYLLIIESQKKILCMDRNETEIHIVIEDAILLEEDILKKNTHQNRQILEKIYLYLQNIFQDFEIAYFFVDNQLKLKFFKEEYVSVIEKKLRTNGCWRDHVLSSKTNMDYAEIEIKSTSK